MVDDGIVFWVIVIGAPIGMLFVPLAIVVNAYWSRIVEWWAVRRLRLGRRHRRADYMRWWDEHR